MVGILGSETPDSNKVGIVRYLSFDPSIVNTLGFLDSDSAKNGNTNMYSTAELLNSFSTTNSDPPRKLRFIQEIVCLNYFNTGESY